MIAALLALSCGTAKSDLRPTDRRAPNDVHVVEEGETLFRIGRRYGVSVEAIQRANRLVGASIRAGQELVIPGREIAAMPPEPIAAPAVEPEARDPLARPAPPVAGACGDAIRSPEASREWIWPVDGVVVTEFGRTEGAMHEGIDIAAPIGTPIWAAKKGRVVFAGERGAYGRIVIVEHEAGQATLYGHNAKNCVAEGGSVDQGEVVALVGETGETASPKVHFEVRKAQNPVNPRHLLP